MRMLHISTVHDTTYFAHLDNKQHAVLWYLELQPWCGHGLRCHYFIIGTYYIPVVSYCLPAVMDVTLLTIVLLKLRRSRKQRIEMQSAAAHTQKSSDATTITLLCMSAVHCTIFITFGLSTVLSTALANASPIVWFRAQTFGNSADACLVISSFANFFIYLARIPAFRAAVLHCAW